MSLAITVVGVAFVLLVTVPKVKMLQVTTVLSEGVTKAMPHFGRLCLFHGTAN